MIDRALSSSMALLGSVTEPDDPFRCMPQMIGAFLLGLRGDCSERAICRFHHRPPIEISESRIEELPHHGLGKVTIRLLDQQEIAVLSDVAQIGELVLVVVPALDL